MRCYRGIQRRQCAVASTNTTSAPNKDDVAAPPSTAEMVESILAHRSDKYFDSASLEGGLYRWWEGSGLFKPSAVTAAGSGVRAGRDEDHLRRPTYTVPMPPPNVTGSLHMGHALFAGIQDVFVRYRRMAGYSVLWLPGTDHAGIATQMVVERSLREKLGAEKGCRKTMGRERFVQEVWKWRESTGGYITRQLRRLGASADWSRETFTLDGHIAAAVSEAFLRLHSRGLVYRADYLIHWSPTLQTALSDLEVEYTEEEGVLYTFKYPIEPRTDQGGGAKGDEKEFLLIATTRPETILGDTAVCVHPQDERFAHLIGRRCLVPFQNRPIPILADESVDMAFGTGALKVTPGHDAVDYAIGARHGLPSINIMNKDGTINEWGNITSPPPGSPTPTPTTSGSTAASAESTGYAGLDRFVCRRRLWADMEREGLAVKKEKHTQRVPRSQRSGEVVESMVSRQWFVNTKSMAARALESVQSGEVHLTPKRFEKTWFQWLGPDSAKDWCISRQLWWGHRIPVYYIVGTDRAEYVVARDEEEALRLAREKVASMGLAAATQPVQVEQDEDVLDTWFSSGLWPFATVGWPNATDEGDYSRHYPATMLETGHDILFFWVARMVMLGLELTGKAPFDTVYLHGLVKDAHGQKMSKTKGNVIDPLEVIDKYGSDVLRYALITTSSPTHDISLSMQAFDTAKTFSTKLWNLGKYVEHMLSALPADRQEALLQEAIGGEGAGGGVGAREGEALSLSDRYILHRLRGLVRHTTAMLDDHRGIAEAGRAVHDFLWSELADWYVESSKLQILEEQGRERSASGGSGGTHVVMLHVWRTLLQLLHPYMPYITESLWVILHRSRVEGAASSHTAGSIMLSQWPGSRVNTAAEGQHSIDVLSENTPEAAEQQHQHLQLESDYACFQSIVKSIRNIRAEYKLDPHRKVTVYVVVGGGSSSPTGDSGSSDSFVGDRAAADQRLLGVLKREQCVIEGLVKARSVEFSEVLPGGAAAADTSGALGQEGQAGDEFAHAVALQGITVFIPIADLAADEHSAAALEKKQKEFARLRKQHAKLTAQIAALEVKLAPTHGFMLRANASTIEQQKALLERCRVELAATDKALELDDAAASQ